MWPELLPFFRPQVVAALDAAIGHLTAYPCAKLQSTNNSVPVTVAAVVGCEKHRDWHSLWTEKAATNDAKVPRTGKDVVKPNGHIRGLMFATPKQPRGEQCPLL